MPMSTYHYSYRTHDRAPSTTRPVRTHYLAQILVPVLVGALNQTRPGRFHWNRCVRPSGKVTGEITSDNPHRYLLPDSLYCQTGQAIVLAPSALTTAEGSTTVVSSFGTVLSRLGRRYMIMKTRQRVTLDGGASLLVLQT